jgi:hypothetical protein
MEAWTWLHGGLGETRRKLHLCFLFQPRVRSGKYYTPAVTKATSWEILKSWQSILLRKTATSNLVTRQ